MDAQPDNNNPKRTSANEGWRLTLFVCVILLLGAGGLAVFILSTEPTAGRGGAAKDTAMLVKTHKVERGNYRPEIVAMGTVEAARRISLRPRISGRILERSDAFTPGGILEKGQTVVRIDPADYENTLKQKKSELQQERADLTIEKGQQRVAHKDYEFFQDALPEEQKDLVLREPQLKIAQADVEAAQAAVDQAQLDLERTRVEAPFKALVVERNANVGSQVSPGDTLGRLIGVKKYWVAATVPLAKMGRLSFSQEGEGKGAPVKVRNTSVWEEGRYRTGYLYKRVGTLEEKTRMARVLVAVPDPLARKEKTGEPPLMLGSYVRAHIQGGELVDVIRVDREYIRENDTVWVMQNGELEIRDPKIAFRGKKYAYIRTGLKEGDRLITSRLTSVVEGAPLRRKGADASAPDSNNQSEAPENR